MRISALIYSVRIEENIEKIGNNPNFLYSIMIEYEAIIRDVATISSSFHHICIHFLGSISPRLVHIKIKTLVRMRVKHGFILHHYRFQVCIRIPISSNPINHFLIVCNYLQSQFHYVLISAHCENAI